MALPWELEEEIICRLPPRSLVRLRTVCKHWNSVFHDKSFVNKHLSRSRPQFIVLTESKIYSIDMIDLDLGTIDKCEIASDFPCEPPMKLRHTNITACDGLLFRYFWRQGVAVWNPWLRQVGWIECEHTDFYFCGVGYDSSRRYKILGFVDSLRRVSDTIESSYYRVAIYECESQALKFIDPPFKQWSTMDPMSVNGNLYWVTHNPDTLEYFIQSFDFSREIFQPFCPLPCQMTYSRSELVLSVFKADRFSLLKQCYATGKIEIWVTKTKIIDTEPVVWINFITLPTTNLPKLISGISYFIFDKTLIMCCGDRKTGAPCIYIVRGDVFKEIPIDSGGAARFSQCVYVPNFISVPQV